MALDLENKIIETTTTGDTGLNEKKREMIISIPGCAAIPNEPDVIESYFDDAEGTVRQKTAATDGYMIPLSLPNGSIVTSYKVFGSDSNNNVAFIRNDLANSGGTTESQTKVNTEKACNFEIKNDNNFYFITVYLAQDDYLYSVRIRCLV